MKKHLQERWEEYAQQCIPEEATEYQRTNMREAFFIGAMNLYDLQRQVDGKTIAEKMAVGKQLMSEVHDELFAFQKTIGELAEAERKEAH